MASHVLVPMDGSPLSETALDVALTDYPDAAVTVLHVIDPNEPGYSYSDADRALDLDEEPLHGSEEWYERAETFTEELFDDARATAAEHGVEVATEQVVGSAAREIVDYVKEHDVDHVILGSHGREEGARIISLLGDLI